MSVLFPVAGSLDEDEVVAVADTVAGLVGALAETVTVLAAPLAIDPRSHVSPPPLPLPVAQVAPEAETKLVPLSVTATLTWLAALGPALWTVIV